MMYGLKRLLIVTLMVTIGLFGATSVLAATSSLADIKVSNAQREATVSVSFNGPPAYAFFPLHGPERVVLDVNQSGKVSGLPLNFSGQNLVKSIRSSRPKDTQSVRLVFDLTHPAKARAVTRQNGNVYTVVFTIAAEGSTNTAVRNEPIISKPATSKPVVTEELTKPVRRAPAGSSVSNPFKSKPAVVSGTATADTPRSSRVSAGSGNRVVVAIDAGHGGQDPGAIGSNGLREKNVTIAVARRLQALLEGDPMFKPVLTRDGDYFISVMGRSEVARKHGANVLVSIHADSAPNRSATGASVWVLNNRRANSEMANWLEQHEKQSELLGGAGDLLANSQADPYLSQAVLDLQFGHSQRVGYDVATKVLSEMQTIGVLHKSRPQPASLGVLRSPDIPSLLVETGFISNHSEERLLGSSAYQDKIARAIHRGLHSYFLSHPLQASPKVENRPMGVTNAKTGNKKSARHKVVRGDTLSSIASRYDVSVSTLKSANKLKSNVAPLDRTLTIPRA